MNLAGEPDAGKRNSGPLVKFALLLGLRDRRQWSAPVPGAAPSEWIDATKYSQVFSTFTLLRPGTGALRFCRVSHRFLSKRPAILG